MILLSFGFDLATVSGAAAIVQRDGVNELVNHLLIDDSNIVSASRSLVEFVDRTMCQTKIFQPDALLVGIEQPDDANRNHITAAQLNQRIGCLMGILYVYYPDAQVSLIHNQTAKAYVSASGIPSKAAKRQVRGWAGVTFREYKKRHGIALFDEDVADAILIATVTLDEWRRARQKRR